MIERLFGLAGRASDTHAATNDEDALALGVIWTRFDSNKSG
jgi:hypothetical protein